MYIFCFAPGDSPEDVNAPTKWCRPPLPNMKADKDKLVFQQIDVDHYIGKINETVFFVYIGNITHLWFLYLDVSLIQFLYRSKLL